MTKEICPREDAGQAVINQHTPVTCVAATQRQQLEAELLFARCCAETCHDMSPLPTLTVQCKTKLNRLAQHIIQGGNASKCW